MAPVLHHWYSAEDAAAAFGGRPSDVYCDGQFVVLPSVVLCFVTTGPTPVGSHVESPSQVVWRPKPGVRSVREYDWLPEPVREVWDRGAPQPREIRRHHLFVRGEGDDRFLYAGGAHLGSYGGGRTTAGEPAFFASFSLDEKLPRDAWVHFGGYPGWQVEVNHKSYPVGRDDLGTFERLVGELARQEFSHLSMTRYEEDSLSVFTNRRRGWLMYLRHPGDSGVYTRDLDDAGPSDSEEVFRCACGIDLEFPTAKTLPRTLALRAAVEFFQSGQLPRCVQWDLE